MLFWQTHYSTNFRYNPASSPDSGLCGQSIAYFTVQNLSRESMMFEFKEVFIKYNAGLADPISECTGPQVIHTSLVADSSLILGFLNQHYLSDHQLAYHVPLTVFPS